MKSHGIEREMMAADGVQALIDSVLAVHGVKLSTAQASAMLSERNNYAVLLRDIADVPCFDDEPGNYIHALSGRRHWRGAAR
jgi:hypothetical protein